MGLAGRIPHSVTSNLIFATVKSGNCPGVYVKNIRTATGIVDYANLLKQQTLRLLTLYVKSMCCGCFIEDVSSYVIKLHA